MMKRKIILGFSIRTAACAAMLLAGAAVTSAAGAADDGLTEKGKALEATYAEQLAQLKAEIEKHLPAIAEANKAAYLKAVADERTAEAAVSRAGQNMGHVQNAKGAVDHAKGKWIGGAEKAIAQAEEDLKKATTDDERKAAQEALDKARKSKEAGLEALKERQAKLDEVLRMEPQWQRELAAAREALAKAKADTTATLQQVGVAEFLGSDRLDEKLARFMVIAEATPRGLATFAQQGRKQEKLIKQLLKDGDLLVQMVMADGASGGQYGRAMEIYTEIQKASRKAKKGVLQRLALATALEHAVAVGQRSATALEDAPKTVDPVKRYLHFEMAYLAGELDAGFPQLGVWDYRMVVDGEEPDEILAWGREMLHNYRPDHIRTGDYRWRYVALVRSDVRYGSQFNKYDKPELQFFQNILMNGGVCGRRAFIGRFILRAFGIPTTARPQPGHAALVHWTPDGWVVCLGGGWGVGTTKGRYKKDLDFLATTQARAIEDAYPQVKRAEWVGSVLGEKPVYGLHEGNPDLWYGISLYTQRRIIEEAEAVALAAVGTDIGEANETKEKVEIEKAELTDEDRAITLAKNGTIIIPAAACSRPTQSTGKILFMDSILGGKQLHYNRNGGAEDFEYTIEVPKAGIYALNAKLVSPSWGQLLLVTVNGAGEPVEIKVPLTEGMWETTEPVNIELAKGSNVLTFSRASEVIDIRGLSIREFTLKPM